MSLGIRIRERRKAAGWSQAQLAEVSGISQQMLSKLERGAAFGTTEIVPLARALKVSPQWLETGEGQMNESIASREDQELLNEVQALGPEEKVALRVVIRAMHQGRLDFSTPAPGYLNFETPKRKKEIAHHPP